MYIPATEIESVKFETKVSFYGFIYKI